MRAMKIMRGDHYNTYCPNCGRSNTYICDGKKAPESTEGAVSEFWKPCHYCKEHIYYRAMRSGKDAQGFPRIAVLAYSLYPDICLHI